MLTLTTCLLLAVTILVVTAASFAFGFAVAGGFNRDE
jgi:hypothetical protein